MFWKRIKIVITFLRGKRDLTILDYGCGTGILSYVLVSAGHKVTSMDVDLGPLSLVQESIDFPNSIKYIESDIRSTNIPKDSFDVICALDVLEHIEYRGEYINHFKRLLKTNGVIIISGPTENFLYKIGRRLAGKRFTGDYHSSNIRQIKKEFSKTFNVRRLKSIPFLFEIFLAYK